MAAWERQQYATAAGSFGEVAKKLPSPRNSYSLGTAEIAAGDTKNGAAHLAEAMKDPSLRADAHFNRGNSALAAREPQRAIPDYVEALKANPTHAGAKRNLEIALAQIRTSRSSLRPMSRNSRSRKGRWISKRFCGRCCSRNKRSCGG
jgi:tetratricopeptide (TPR) repeat protein